MLDFIILDSEVVFGAPSTQVKVERDFSAFSLIYSHLRTAMSDELLNAIFILKFNLDLIPKVNFLLPTETENI